MGKDARIRQRIAGSRESGSGESEAENPETEKRKAEKRAQDESPGAARVAPRWLRRPYRPRGIR
jgi:hypothetical protein